MELVILEQAKKDLAYWKASGNIKIQKRISALIEDTLAHPFTGIGKPEALKGNLQGKWSRRINDEHRMIYSVADGKIYLFVLSLRYHYKKD
ncbi:MAG: Txe/YoeB family addiction module toxin [Paludibacteraceae bacterium]|nr:Txe/YoeB family addiction module toxin [Paludibacteraceae bacterium]